MSVGPRQRHIRNREARVWFRGLEELQKTARVRAVYDLSATPYYLKGSGYSEGFIFPWVVSDFSLMDAIESGIVKVPRPPVDDQHRWPACRCSLRAAVARPGRCPVTTPTLRPRRRWSG